MNLKQTYNSGKLLVGGKAKCFILLLPENIRKYGKLRGKKREIDKMKIWPIYACILYFLICTLLTTQNRHEATLMILWYAI